MGLSSGYRLQPFLRDKVEQLKRGSSGALVTPLPLAHPPWRHIEITGKDGLTCFPAEPDLADLPRRQFFNRSQTHHI